MVTFLRIYVWNIQVLVTNDIISFEQLVLTALSEKYM